MSARLLAVLAVAFAPALAVAQDPADTLAATIDRMLSSDWESRGIKPAAPADDAEFVRRVYLDVIGRAPKAAETRDFLDDKAADKRIKLVEKLLSMPAHANYFAAVTRNAWMPQAATNIQFAQAGFQIEQWLVRHFRANTPADVVATKLLTFGLNRGPLDSERCVANAIATPADGSKPTLKQMTLNALIQSLQLTEVP